MTPTLEDMLTWARRVARRLAPRSPVLEDLVQVAQVAVWRCGRRYDPSRGDFFAFALPYVRGRVLDELHRHRAQAGAAAQAAQEPQEVPLHDAPVVRAWMSLNGPERAAVQLVVIQQLTCADAARLMGVSKATVSRAMARGLAAIRARVTA